MLLDGCHNMFRYVEIGVRTRMMRKIVLVNIMLENIMMGGVIKGRFLFAVRLAWLEAGVQVIEAGQHGCTKA